MKISGFTFIRNGHSLDYPFVESIKSILPIVDELVVVVGNSDDDTRETVENLDKSKIKIIDTVWDESIRVGGAILAQQTNVALDHITGDWGLYIYSFVRLVIVQEHLIMLTTSTGEANLSKLVDIKNILYSTFRLLI